ncbi:TPA: hypothetical protein ACQUIH_002081, partial [Neisseria lactamica]
FSIMRNFPLSSVEIIMIIYYITLHRNEKSEKTKTPSPSFPRKRESGNERQQEFIGNGRDLKVWIPACAGMTNLSAQKPAPRHSRKSGNLEMKSSRNLSEITETERTGFPPARE